MQRTLLLASLLALTPAVAAQSIQLATPIGNVVLTPSTPPNGANTVYFDINVTSASGILVTDIDLNVTLGGTGQVDVYVTSVGGSFLPVVSSPTAWTRVGTAPMTSVGNGVFSPGPLNTPFYLATGTYGVALHLIGLQHRYTNPGNPATIPLTYSDANLLFDCNLTRIRNSIPTDPFTGGSSANPRVPSMRWTYTTNPQAVDFTATPTRGASPLTVQFTNQAFSGLPGGILVYAWDFDNDGNVDSNLPNPTHTYTTCGNYTVSLTIVDQSGPYTETKTNFIQTDVVVPDFTTQLVAPLTLQFTDTSSPTPTAWSWDLDGDGLIDSTLQNPTFVYPAGMACGEVEVRLIASRACQPAAQITRRIAVSKSLTTRFDGGTFTTTGATGGTNFFDLNVTNPQGIVVCAMHIHSAMAAGNPIGVNVWVTPGTYVGNHQNAAVWRQIATGTGTSRGFNQRTYVPFTTGFYLPQGSYGVAVEHVGASPYYINVGNTQTFTNADMTLTAGLTQTTAAGVPIFDPLATVFSPRIWNGAIYYTTCNVVADAGYGFFGEGCAGSLGVPGNTATTLPRIGTTMTVSVTNLPANAGFMLLGLSRTFSVFGPLPLNLAPLGAAGCTARVSSDTSSLILGAGGTASFNLALPNSPNLLCIQFYTQALALAPGQNPLGAVTSDAAAGIIGR